MQRTRTLAVVAVATCALAGCGGSDPGPASSEAPAPQAEPYTVEAGLRSLPTLPTGGDEPLLVATGDLAAAADLADLSLPTDDASAATWFRALTVGRVHVDAPETLQRIGAGRARRALGLDAADISGFASVVAPEGNLTVYRLREGAPGRSPAFSGDGVAGDIDPAPKEDAAFPVVHGIGRRGDDVALSRYPDALAAWQSGDDVLAADGALLEVARALDDNGVYSALLTDAPGIPRSVPRELFDELGPTVVPRFNAAGVGQSVVGGRAVEYVAYQLDDAPSAKDAIEAAWRDGLTLDPPRALSSTLDVDEVFVNGNVVILRISAKNPSPGLAGRMLSSTDGPFLSSGASVPVID